MSKWKCGICNSEFDNYQAQGFNGIIYCPLCYFKELYKREKQEIEKLTNNWNELEEWVKEYINKNDNWYNNELSTHDKQYYGDSYYTTNYMLEKFLDKMKEIKDGKNE